MKAFLQIFLVALMATVISVPSVSFSQSAEAGRNGKAASAKAGKNRKTGSAQARENQKVGSPMDRFKLRLSQESAEKRAEAEAAIATLGAMSASEFLAQAEPWFSNGQRIKDGKNNGDAARTIAAEKLLADDVVSLDAGIVGRLADLGVQRLSKAQRVDLMARFVAGGSWSSLSAEELLAEATKKGGVKKSFLRRASKSLAAKFIRDKEFVKTADPDVLKQIFDLGESRLSRSERESVGQSVLGDRALEASASFAQVKEWYAIAKGFPASFEAKVEIRSQLAAWLKGRKLGELSSKQKGWLISALSPKVSVNESKGVVAVWSGKLTVPSNGKYRFSISPLDVNMRAGDGFVRQNYRVVINGQTVIETQPVDDNTATDWVWQSEPITLRKNQSVSLEYVFDYGFREASEITARVAAPILFWESRRLSRQVVPASAFKTKEDKPGVDFKMTWTGIGKAQTAEGVDTNIDSIWVDTCILSYENKKLRQRLARALINEQTSRKALSQFDKDQPKSHPLQGGRRSGSKLVMAYLESASSADRLKWIERVCRTPEHFSIVRPDRLYRLFQVARAGLEVEALELIKTWSEVHSDDPPTPRDDSRMSRYGYKRIGVHLLATEHEGAIERLEADSLENENGECSLPIASICGYGYLVQGKILQWIEKLDQRLADESLQGDRRVNWLIARAVAEEIRSCPAQRRVSGHEQYLLGLGWLQEAMLVAESSEVRARVVEEMVARCAACGDTESGKEMLDKESGKLAGSDATRVKRKWTKAMARAEDLQQERAIELEREQQLSITAEMRRRQRSAAKRGDGAAAAKFGDLAEQMQSIIGSQ